MRWTKSAARTFAGSRQSSYGSSFPFLLRSLNVRPSTVSKGVERRPRMACSGAPPTAAVEKTSSAKAKNLDCIGEHSFLHMADAQQGVNTQCRLCQNACHSPETETPRRFLRTDKSRQSPDAGPWRSKLGSFHADGPCCPLLSRATFAVSPSGRQWERGLQFLSRHRPAQCDHRCAWLSWIAVKCPGRWFQRQDQPRDLSCVLVRLRTNPHCDDNSRRSPLQ